MSEVVKVKYEKFLYKDYLERGVLIDLLAQRYARLQAIADYQYYVKQNIEASSNTLNTSIEIVELAENLGIFGQVLNKALEIYNFKEKHDKDYITKKMQKLMFIRNINNKE